VSIVVADCHPVFLHGLISILQSDRIFDIVASCCDGMKCLQAIRELSPDIALLDSSMPILSGVKVLATSIGEGSRTRILLLAAATEQVSTFAAAIGAYGVVPRDVLPDVLIHDLRQVAAGQRLSIRASRAGEVRTKTYTCENTLAMLTERERQIAKLVSAGLSNKQVGQQLNLSAGTIKVHLHNIYQKLEINNRTTLTALAVSGLYNTNLAVTPGSRLHAQVPQANQPT
jgi:two-component system, NarL family, nitrate/nitrite response regulator NarL